MRTILLATFTFACSAEQPRAVTIEHAAAKPVATESGTLLAPKAPPHEVAACLMLYECGCNAGCTRIDHALDSLSPGMQVVATSGPLKGTPVFVSKTETPAGETVLTVGRADPKAAIQICAMNPPSSVVGYLCGGGSGPPRVCATCAD